MKKKLLITALACCIIHVGFAHEKATIREYEKQYTTYPFSDPNPVPVFGKIYPYFRYDGFTANPVNKKWKIVELENDFLRIKIFPEIGGKIWSVWDKSSGKELFYGNDVVKFRDISLRGPWTSGGIEFNYGVIGHAPGCSFPVDYLIRENPDNSVSCIISSLDLLTRTRWSVEINLPCDKGWFTTRSFWHNGTPDMQPYYNWVNTGVAAKKDLQFIYPGTHSIRHDGITFPWPFDSVRGKDLSFWAENNFISSKSYHVTGSYSPYFSAYWSDEDFGMMHYSSRDDKPGSKIFTWALSDQGKIWEELLTDKSGQYVELQSGRLFNQNMVISSLTPYKQFGFMPYATDSWDEYWFPYTGTNGASNAGLSGVVHLERKGEMLDFRIYPLQQIHDTLKFYTETGNLLRKEYVELSVAHTWHCNIPIPGKEDIQRIVLAGKDIWSSEDKTLKRPVQSPENFNWETAHGKYLRGRDVAGMRLYDQAEVFIRESLKIDPGYLPSLVEMSRLYDYRMKYDSAFYYARKALAIDTYDAAANYEYGKAALKLKDLYNALDGFEIAALTTPYRSAAYTGISKICVSRKEYEKAFEYARKSLLNNQRNIEGLQLAYLANLLLGQKEASADFIEKLLQLDPMNQMVWFEQYLLNKSPRTKQEFQGTIRNELPVQAYLELGVWYYSLGLEERSRCVFELAPQDAEVKYWLAFLNRNNSKASVLLAEAEAMSPAFVFPFRQESKEVFEWAIEKSTHWMPRYLLALLHLSKNNTEEAGNLLKQTGDQPDFAPLYAVRAQVEDNSENAERDLIKAVSLNPTEWRYVHQLTQFYTEQSNVEKALKTITPFYNANKSHFPTGTLYARTLIRSRQYEEAEKILKNIFILPFEGAKDGHNLYRSAKLMLAVQALQAGKVKDAQRKIDEARLWPRNLGVGKPYDEVNDTRIEDWLSAMVAIKTGDKKKRDDYLRKVACSNQEPSSINTLFQVLALDQLREHHQAEMIFRNWNLRQEAPQIQKWGDHFYQSGRNKDFPFDSDGTSKIIEFITGSGDQRLF